MHVIQSDNVSQCSLTDDIHVLSRHVNFLHAK